MTSTTTSPWLQIKLRVGKIHLEKLEDALLAAGALSVTLKDDADQPLFEPDLNHPPLWDDLQVTGLFAGDTNVEQALIIATAEYGSSLPTYKLEWLEDKDWERSWMDNFKPIACGKRLWICPSWVQPPDPNAINLKLDPGLAFGTGNHPTTWMCLNWLEAQNLNGKIVLDFGCGSGILAIAALLLGADSAIGVDTDPQALTASRENSKNNLIIEQKLRLFLPEEFIKQYPLKNSDKVINQVIENKDSAENDLSADISLANILAGPLVELAPNLAQSTKIGGLLCLSGILKEQAEQVKSAYEPYFEMLDPIFLEEWVCLTGFKR